MGRISSPAGAVEMCLAPLAGQPRRLSPRDSLWFPSPLFEEQVCGYECGEDYGDYSVHGEEGGV
jgi:hypothetical protein